MAMTICLQEDKGGGEERVDPPKMAKKTKKEEGGGIKACTTRKVGRERYTPVVVEIHSSSSDGGGAADDDASNGASNGKESAASSTNNLPSKTRPGKRPKVADLAGNSKVGCREEEGEEEGEEEEEEEEEEGGRGGGDCYSAIRVRRVIKNEADWRTSQDALFLITAASARFMQVLVNDAYAERKKVVTIGYNHVASAVSKKKRYEFLSDFVPQKILGKDALLEKAVVDDPA